MKYKMSKKYGRALLSSDEVREVVESRGQDVINLARGYAGERTGEYKESFELHSGKEYSTKGDRIVAHVENTSDHAAAHEWGRGAKRPLQRAMEDISNEEGGA